MNKLESTIPFDGFYESFISADIENQIELVNSFDSDEPNKSLLLELSSCLSHLLEKYQRN